MNSSRYQKQIKYFKNKKSKTWEGEESSEYQQKIHQAFFLFPMKGMCQWNNIDAVSHCQKKKNKEKNERRNK